MMELFLYHNSANFVNFTLTVIKLVGLGLLIWLASVVSKYLIYLNLYLTRTRTISGVMGQKNYRN